MRVLVLPLLLASLAQNTPPAMTLYRNTMLHFEFAYPAEFKSWTEPGSSGTASSAPRPWSAVACLSTPVIAEHDVDNSNGEMLTMMDLDLGCLKQPTDAGKLDTFVTEALRNGLHQDGSPTMAAGGAYKVDGHDARFRVATLTSKPESTTIYAGAACVAVEQHLICWNVLAMSRARVNALLSSPISFAGHATQALVPAASLNQ